MSPAAFTIAPLTWHPQRRQGALRGPALDQSGRVQSTGHGPWIEPASRRFPGGRARLEDVPDLGGRSASAISPRRRRLTGLSGFQVLNTVSALLEDRARGLQPAATWAPARPSAVYTSMVTTVPITVSRWCSACSAVN